jgi:hypothetical protein
MKSKFGNHFSSSFSGLLVQDIKAKPSGFETCSILWDLWSMRNYVEENIRYLCDVRKEALISIACKSADLFVRSPASVVFDKYPVSVPAIPICLLAFRNIPLFFDGAAYLTFRLHILKYFGVFF